ncbi:MAG: glucose-6-phosphate dehydrogenase [Cyanobacteria bacterium J06649_11]
MTAFTQTDIPANVDTLEKLALWVGTALHSLNFDQTAVEGTGTPVRVTQNQLFFIENTNTHRIMLRQSIEVDATFPYSGEKLWTHAQELSTTAIPSEFLVA